MSKKKSNACHTHYFFHLLYFQLLYEQVYSCIQQISKLWSLFLLDPHTDCSVLIVCTPPPFPPSSLPLLLMKGLSLLPHFQKEELDMTLIFRGGLVGKRGVPFLREGGGSCNFYKKKKLKSETSNDRKKFINKNVFLCHNEEFKQGNFG